MTAPSVRALQNSADNISSICFAPAPQNYHDVCTIVVHSQPEFLADLPNYDVAVVGMGTTLFGSVATEVDAFVNGGGGLVAVFPYAEPGLQPLPSGFEVTITDPLWPGAPEVPPPAIELTPAGVGHPIVEGVSLDPVGDNVKVIGIAPVDTLGAGWTLLAESQGHPHAALAAGSYGAGRMVLTGISVPSDPNGLKLMGQMVTWAGGGDAPAATPSPIPTSSPTPTPPSGPDVQIDAIEVTQAIQDLNNSVDLIAHKRTFARVHVSAPERVLNVSATLTGKRKGQTLERTLVPANRGANIIIDSIVDRGQINDSFFFELPSDWLDAGPLTLTATLEPDAATVDPNLANNVDTVTVDFLDAPPLSLRLYNVIYAVDGKAYRADDVHLERAESWLKRAYPISELAVRRRNFFYPEEGVPTAERLFWWLGRVRWLALRLTDDTENTYHYGMVDDGGGLVSGRAESIFGRIAVGATGPTDGLIYSWDQDGSYGDTLMGHEVGHLLGRFHADFCNVGENNFVAPYPYELGRISPTLTGDRAIYGFDGGNIQIYDPNWRDIMTYCDYKWVSDFTYEGIRQDMAAARAANAATVRVEKFFLVSGIISDLADLRNPTIDLLDVQLISQTKTLPLSQAGNWAIALLDSANQELATYPLAPQGLTNGTDDGRTPALISAAVPWVNGAVTVAIRNGAQMVATKSASAHAPTVTITTPTQGQAFGNGPIQFEWTGADTNQDPLTYSVLYRHAADTEWEVLSTNLVTPALTIDASLLPGGESSYLQIIASDGFLTGVNTVGPFTVPAGKPVVKIESPLADGATFVPGQMVTLQGISYDPEDGQLANAALSWTSSMDGDLGTGTTVQSSALSTGDHTITFTATDSDGATAQAQRSLSILTGTEAEPDSLHIAPIAHNVIAPIGATAEFSTTFTVRNGGDAALDWDARTKAAWISLANSSGTTPSGLTVTVDVTGLALGRHQGTVSFVVGELEVEIPVVVLVVEESAQSPPQAKKVVYLPIVTR